MPSTTSESYRFFDYAPTADIYNKLSQFEGSIRTVMAYTGDLPCGAIQFTPTYEVEGQGAPGLGYRMMQYYYETLCDFCYAIPRAPDWIIFIAPHNRPYLVGEIGNLKKYEPTRSGTDWELSGAPDKLSAQEAQDIIGCIFSHGVTVPGETIDVQQAGAHTEKTQGFLKGPIVTNRQDLSQLQVVFKETVCSYTDMFIRPWSILLGHKGFHARPQEESIKADIMVYHLQPTLPYQRPVIRKAFSFYDAAPVSVNAEDHNYDGDALIQRQVSFAFNSYSVWDGTEVGGQLQAVTVGEGERLASERPPGLPL